MLNMDYINTPLIKSTEFHRTRFKTKVNALNDFIVNKEDSPMTKVGNQARLCNLLLMRRRKEQQMSFNATKSPVSINAFKMKTMSPVQLFSQRRSYVPIENKELILPIIKLSNLNRSKFNNGLKNVDEM
jgi:hypothetical protein